MSDRFEKVMELAKRLFEAGFAIIPAEYKRPLVRVSEWRERWKAGEINWDEIETELIKYINKPGLNLMILTGVNGIYALDFDSKEAYQDFLEALPSQLREKILRTLTTETRRGYHVYLRCDQDDLRPQKMKIGEVEWKGFGQQVNAPWSVYEDGSESRPVRGWSEDEIHIEEFTREEIEIIWDILGLSKEVQIPELEFMESVDLNDDQITSIIEIIRNYYREGFRDLLIFGLSGFMTKLKVKFEAAEKLVQRITEEFQDEEAKQRLYVLKYVYQRAKMGRVVPGLRTLAEIFKQSGAENGEKIAWRIRYIIIPEEMEIPIELAKLRENMWKLKGRRIRIRNVVIKKEGIFNKVVATAWICTECGNEVIISGEDRPGKCENCKSKSWEIDEKRTKLKPILILRLIDHGINEIAYGDVNQLPSFSESEKYDVIAKVRLVEGRKKKIIPQVWVEDIRPVEDDNEDYDDLWMPNSLDDLVNCYRKRIVGEDKTIKIVMMALASYLDERKHRRIYGIMLQGPSSIGKTHLIKFQILIGILKRDHPLTAFAIAPMFQILIGILKLGIYAEESCRPESFKSL